VTIWQMQVNGDQRDLEFLANIFEVGAQKVLRDPQGDGYLYESDAFRSCSSSEEVEQIGGRELAILSGILKLERDARAVLQYGAVHKLYQDGRRDIFVRIKESVQARVDVGAVTVQVTDAGGSVVATPSPPQPRAAKLLTLSVADEAVEKVLRLLSAPDVITWVGLYRLHEVIEANVGGQHTLEKMSWGSAEGLRRFKHSANSVQVGGDHSRHGSEQQAPPRNPMSLAEAEAYVKYIVQAWLASKGA